MMSLSHEHREQLRHPLGESLTHFFANDARRQRRFFWKFVSTIAAKCAKVREKSGREYAMNFFTGKKMGILLAVGLAIGFLIPFEVALRAGGSDRYSGTEIKKAVDRARAYHNQADSFKTDFIPHPYFGFIFKPNAKFSQVSGEKIVPMQANSDGFLDNEFPTKKSPGECVIGLFGASNAMSWGVSQRSDRINAKLEELLTQKAISKKCASYRVLNLAMAGYTSVQALNTYIYFDDILDGAIFYGGFNDCQHAAILDRPQPLRYPWTDIYPLLQVNHPNKKLVDEEKAHLSQVAGYLQNHETWLQSFLVRKLFVDFVEGKIQKIQGYNSEISHLVNSASVSMVQSKDTELLELMKEQKSKGQFYYSKDADFQNRVLRAALPIVYTKPLAKAFVISQMNKKGFLNLVQPFEPATKGRPTWQRQKWPQEPTYQFRCEEMYREQAKTLAGSGLKTYFVSDDPRLDELSESPFIDGAHFGPEGNELVAKIIFEKITKSWSLFSGMELASHKKY